jgi:HK97 family phage prohead protease
MPYYISDQTECPDWAVIKDDGEVIACHDTKESAIDQAVAISIAEDEPFEGERAAIDSLVIGDYVSWDVLNPTILAQVVAVEGEMAVIQLFEYEDGIFEISDKLMIINVFKIDKVRKPEMIAVELEETPDSEEESEGNLPENYRPALSEDVPEGRACGNCFFFDESRINEDGDKAWCERWDAFVDGGYYCNAWQPNPEDRAEPDELVIGDFVSWDNSGGTARGRIVRIVRDGEINIPNSSFTITGTPEDPAALIVLYREGEDGYAATSTRVGHKFSTLTKIASLDREARAINQEAPAYMRAAARRGLEYYAEGLGGDGLVPATIRDARLMAEGTVSDQKWIRTAAWIARHLGDLDSPDADPTSDNYPSAGVVAHLLWGSGPSKRAAQRALDYAESVVARIRAEESERMTEPVMDEARAKWLKAAYAIKAKIEGTDEARALGKNETRTNHIELRAEGDGRTFTGYAALFNEPSLPLPFTEYVRPGAFKRSLQSRNRMMLLWNHDTSNPLASTRNGSLQMVEDARGLKVTATLPDTTLGRDIAELVRTGVVDSMSFGFSVKKDSWSQDGQVRYLEDVTLYEVSLVSTPAYEATAGTVSVRSGISADDLADALLKIESGEELEPEQGALVNEVIGKLTKTPEVEEVEGDILALKQKKLALLMMGI